MLLVDGLRPDIAERELQAGHLPNLAQLTASGSRTRAVTVFPSTTSVAYLPFLTGELPGRCGVPSIRWLDRTAYGGRWWREREAVRSYCGYQAGHLDRDIDPVVRTIFQDVPESVAIFSMITRGLTPDRDLHAGARKFWGTISHFTEWHQPGDDAVARGLLAAVDGPSRFIFAQFPAVDGYTHAQGPEGPKVLEALRRVDATIGAVVSKLDARGELGDTLVMVVSDHGSSAVHSHLDLATWLRAQGVPTLAHPVLWTRNPGAAVMVAGNGAAGIYARPGIPRRHRLAFDQLRRPEAVGAPIDVVAGLVAESAVALVAAENDDGGLRVASRDGEADLARVGETISYRIRSGDPLRVGGSVTASDREWLASTIDGPFPDAPAALLDQFCSHRSGDLVVAASEGWDFRDAWEYPKHRAGHGSLIAPHMLTPAWSNCELPHGALRTVDLHGIMLEWLGAA